MPQPNGVIQPLQLDHLVLRSVNPSRLIAFYCQVLGCTVERETSPQVGLTQLRAGAALIDIVDVNAALGSAGGAAPSRTGNNMDHFCLQIAPVSEAQIIRHLRLHGVEAGAFRHRYGAQGRGASLYIEDCDGNQLELRCKLAK
ncbi:VOC family protein [Motilimonas pumila]|uniref:VOC family protein n=1 Tax=Motilimonas pumila TaxID=2303987 RepID=A0A418YFE2_9GAMM|nr:VOC family protein [Motilimonas pumila]RJG47914.1 VOC family protein [Motilimonas pumila]